MYRTMTQNSAKSKIPWAKYALYCVPFLAGMMICTVLIVYAYRSVVSIGESYQRMIVPGEIKINIPAPGTLTIFHEYKSVMGNEIFSSQPDSISGIRCNVKNLESGDEIGITTSAANSTYSLGSREGKAIFDVVIQKAGIYEFKCSFPDGGHRRAKTVFAIGQGFGGEIFTTIALIFGAVMVFLISASITTALIVIKEYNRSKQ